MTPCNAKSKAAINAATRKRWLVPSCNGNTRQTRSAKPVIVKRIAGHPASTQNQNQSLSGWRVREAVSDASRKIAKISSKFPRPMPHQGEARMS